MDIRLDLRSADALEVRLREIARTSGAALRPLLTPVLGRRGKRMRPWLLLTFAGVPTGMAAVTCAAGVELLHQSSLVHDDLMDSAPLRGGVPAVHTTHGPGMAVVAGDFLVAAGMESLASVGSWHAMAGLRAYADMCRGQAQETADRHRLVHVDQHLGVLAGKTGALLRAACAIGARLAGLDRARVERAGRYGLALGVLYQLVDDLLDLGATAAEAGKPVGQDIANGIYTLPVLLAADRHGDAFAEHLSRGSAGLAAARDLALREDVMADVAGYIRRYAAAAEDNARALPPGPARARLAALPGRLVARAITGRATTARATR